MMASLLGGEGKWVHCKHMYYILQHVMYCGKWKNSFMIQLKVRIKFNAYKIVLIKLSFVQCIEWSIFQKCRLVVTCASGQYIIVIDICPLFFHSTSLMDVKCIISLKCKLILSKASNIILTRKLVVVYGDGQYFIYTYLLSI